MLPTSPEVLACTHTERKEEIWGLDSYFYLNFRCKLLYLESDQQKQKVGRHND